MTVRLHRVEEHGSVQVLDDAGRTGGSASTKFVNLITMSSLGLGREKLDDAKTALCMLERPDQRNHLTAKPRLLRQVSPQKHTTWTYSSSVFAECVRSKSEESASRCFDHDWPMTRLRGVLEKGILEDVRSFL